jgi:hypothetical protein
MTEEELEIAITVHARRRKVFMAEGLCEQEAWDLAERMLNRDADPLDDRRVCFECKHYMARLCTKIRDRYGKPTMQVRFILQRCDHITLKGSK